MRSEAVESEPDQIVRLRFAPAHGTILAVKVHSTDENRIMNIEELRASLEARNEVRPQSQLPLLEVKKELERHREEERAAA